MRGHPSFYLQWIGHFYSLSNIPPRQLEDPQEIWVSQEWEQIKYELEKSIQIHIYVDFSQTESLFDFWGGLCERGWWFFILHKDEPHLCWEGWWCWAGCLPAHKSTECLKFFPLYIEWHVAAWNWPWGGYLHQGDQETVETRASSFFPRDSCQTFTNKTLGAWIHNECMVFFNFPLII